jgi:DNA polymerase IV (DinB-like DNA polymerase)
MHADLDAFYAAVEEKNNPEYTGKPIIVGADPKNGEGRGVVSTCNYKAREYGIHSAMPISRAWKLCPEAIYLSVNMSLYAKVSKRIMSILRSYADKFEQISIDEAFLDVSQRTKNLDGAEKLAKKIKEEIKKKEGLTLSIGIGPNKLIAKIASDFRKPDGLIVIEEKNAKDFLATLEVNKIRGIGPKTKNRLNNIGIITIGDLASYSVNKLVVELGSWGAEFHRMAQGIDNSEVLEEREPKSFSREHTFEHDVSDASLVNSTIDQLCEDLLTEVNYYDYFFKTVTVKIRYEDFETFTRAKSLSLSTNKKEVLKKVACKLVEPFLDSLKKVRLIGVKVSNLSSHEDQKILDNL